MVTYLRDQTAPAGVTSLHRLSFHLHLLSNYPMAWPLCLNFKLINIS